MESKTREKQERERASRGSKGGVVLDSAMTEAEQNTTMEVFGGVLVGTRSEMTKDARLDVLQWAKRVKWAERERDGGGKEAHTRIRTHRHTHARTRTHREAPTHPDPRRLSPYRCLQ